MPFALSAAITKKLQKLLWVYWTNNFVITTARDFTLREAAIPCEFTRITHDNCVRVQDFRTDDRVEEYRNKLAHQEIGFYAESGGKTAGSIWATINRTQASAVARGHIKLMHDEALIHDIVTGEKFRGMGVGPFMVSRMALALLNEYRVLRIIIDVNVKNNPSLRMMDKAGVRVSQQVFSISAFGTLAFERVLKQYA